MGWIKIKAKEKREDDISFRACGNKHIISCLNNLRALQHHFSFIPYQHTLKHKHLTFPKCYRPPMLCVYAQAASNQDILEIPQRNAASTKKGMNK